MKSLKRDRQKKMGPYLLRVRLQTEERSQPLQQRGSEGVLPLSRVGQRSQALRNRFRQTRQHPAYDFEARAAHRAV